jgi:PAS domain S-box-containing protein
MTLLINASPSLMAYWGRDLRCRFASRTYSDYFGRHPSADLSGMTKKDLLGEALYARSLPMIEAVLAGTPQHFEREMENADGSRVHTLTHFIPDTVGGEVVGFTTHVFDVSVLKETEARLREEIAERRRAYGLVRTTAIALEQAQRLARVGSWFWHSRPDTVQWSKEMYRIFGRDPWTRAPTFAEQHEIFTPESWARASDAVAIALRTGEPYQLDLEFIRPDGVGGWLDARGEIFKDTDGSIIGLHGTAREITRAD